MTADQIIEGILGKEGGYVDHPSDKGGPTRWGITQTTARAHGYTGDMRNLPRETAKQILLSDYWTGPRFDQVAALSTLLADELCDTGVNMGPSVASKFFQRWLTAMNMRGKLYPDLIPDGAMWGGDRLCMDGSSPRKQREALRDKAWGRTSRICTAGRKMRFFYDLCDEFCTILDC